jgi:hypothetical protein
MKRLSAILFAVLFVTGFLVAPAVHQAYCANEHSGNDTGNCAICQIAHTPFQFSAAILAPVDVVRRVDTLIPAVLCIPQFSPRSVTQARAPPV